MRGAMFSYTVISSHSQVRDPESKGPLVSNSTFAKNSFRNTIRVSSSFDPDQAQRNVVSDPVLNYLQRLSADDTRGLRVKAIS